MPLVTFVSFILFTGLVALATWLLTRHDRHDTTDGYFLGGRKLTGGYIAGSLLLTNLSTEQLVGLNGAAFEDGLCVMAWEVIAGLSLVVMGLFFLPRYLRGGVATVPQFLAQRFDRHTRTITTVIFIAAYAAILLPIVLYTGATGLIGILDLPELTGIRSHTVLLWGTVWLIGLLGSMYAIFGGLRTVAVSDTLNGFGLLAGGLLILWLGLRAVDSDSVLAAVQALYRSHPEKFNSLGGPGSSVPFSTLFTGVLLLNLFYWCTNQQIIQRAFGASSLKEGQRGVMLAGTFKVLAPLILVLPGIIAYHLYAAEGLHRDHAYGRLVRDVLPRPLAGFFAAVVVGAVLSSFNSALNSTATLFSLGVYKELLRPQADERAVIRSSKVFGWAVALVSMTVAPLLAGQESIFAYLQKMNGLYFIPIFAVVLVGMTTRHVPASAANAALIVGVAAIAAGYFFPPLARYVTAMHEYHFLGAVFAGLVLLMLLIGAVRPAGDGIDRNDDPPVVDLTPWRWARPYGLVLLAVVLAVYVWFADLSVVRPSQRHPTVTPVPVAADTGRGGRTAK
ncbi:MAG: solute:sodium symporter family transporter [Planctomycetota bacterium]|nr:MAG: solute:sodium symporter family transporter [Planctomycetota bacterium]